ncbi:MAG: heavy metal-responsive transcriptional regulator [Actinomycetota bacterium]|jgi:DNA-binding transcriptional MerR regulator|nr:heavy metal-responsive transcriptional regulator [Actinomycetota bacterium]
MLDSVSQLTVSKLASEVGTSSDTLRYYERIGLLPAPERSPAGYRLYGAEMIERVRFIKRAQRFGLRLEEIGELLSIRERGLCPCGRTRSMLEDKVQGLTEEMTALQRLRDDIQEMLEEHLAAGETDGWQCGSGLIQLGRRTKTSEGASYECF